MHVHVLPVFVVLMLVLVFLFGSVGAVGIKLIGAVVRAFSSAASVRAPSDAATTIQETFARLSDPPDPAVTSAALRAVLARIETAAASEPALAIVQAKAERHKSARHARQDAPGARTADSTPGTLLAPLPRRSALHRRAALPPMDALPPRTPLSPRSPGRA